MKVDRREFLAAAASLASALASSSVAQSGDPAPDWGGPVVDTHLHLRDGLDANYVTLQGCGVTHAVLRARDTSGEQVRAIRAKYPKLFVWTASADITKPEAEAALTKAIKHGAVGLGEIKSHVAADGPELRRMYALAADLNVTDHDPLPGGPPLRRRGCLRHRLQAVRGNAEGVSEDPIHRPRRRVLGERQRRLRERDGLPSGPDQAGRNHRQAARATIRISSAICRPTPAITRCRVTPTFTRDFLSAIRTS